MIVCFFHYLLICLFIYLFCTSVESPNEGEGVKAKPWWTVCSMAERSGRRLAPPVSPSPELSAWCHRCMFVSKRHNKGIDWQADGATGPCSRNHYQDMKPMMEPARKMEPRIERLEGNGQRMFSPSACVRVGVYHLETEKPRFESLLC